MLHLLAFNIFARPCGKKRGAQQKANPSIALFGEKPGARVGTKTWGKGRGC